MSTRRPPPSPPTASFLPMLLIVGVLLVVAAVAILIIPRREPTAPAETGGEVVDPFAGLAADEPPPARPGGRRPPRDVEAPAPAENPFEGLESLLTAEIWVQAKAKAQEGLRLADEAGQARVAGDSRLFKQRGKEAKGLLEEALEGTGDWELEIGKEAGFDHPEVRRIVRERSRWRRELVALKKTVGW